MLRGAVDSAAAHGAVTLTKGYEPYGGVLYSQGSGASSYGYTGEWLDETGLVYLRARYYSYRDARFVTRDSWQGDDAMPLSYNAWLYGYANPQRFTDPTGFVSLDESKEAGTIVRFLSAAYGITLISDWGVKQIPVPVPGQQNECAWKNGRWSLWDLRLLKDSVEELSNRMKNYQNFRHLVGPVTIVKISDACGRGCTYNFGIYQKIAFLDVGKPAKEAPFSNLIMTHVVDFDAWSVVHELGHAWDNHFHNRLSAGLEEQTGGHTDPRNELPKNCDPHEPGCNDAGYFYGSIPPKGADAGFTRLEDFAESVAAYVFPSYAQNRVMGYLGTKYEDILYYADYSVTERFRYIDTLINEVK
jgi:RHS repeat-associated protein